MAAADLQDLTEAELSQLVTAINEGQQGWNRARPDDLNQFQRANERGTLKVAGTALLAALP